MRSSFDPEIMDANRVALNATRNYLITKIKKMVSRIMTKFNRNVS